MDDPREVSGQEPQLWVRKACGIEKKNEKYFPPLPVSRLDPCQESHWHQNPAFQTGYLITAQSECWQPGQTGQGVHPWSQAEFTTMHGLSLSPSEVTLVPLPTVLQSFYWPHHYHLLWHPMCCWKHQRRKWRAVYCPGSVLTWPLTSYSLLAVPTRGFN